MLDRNHLQIDGTTETVMNSAPLEDKLRAFNFNVVTINGHDLSLIHILPLLTGQVPKVGNMLCPMHFPVLLCGFMLGGPWGLAVGFEMCIRDSNGIGHIGNAGALDRIQNDAGGLFGLGVESLHGALDLVKVDVYKRQAPAHGCHFDRNVPIAWYLQSVY